MASLPDGVPNSTAHDDILDPFEINGSGDGKSKCNLNVKLFIFNGK